VDAPVSGREAGAFEAGAFDLPELKYDLVFPDLIVFMFPDAPVPEHGWIDRTVRPPPASWPQARTHGAVVYDGERKRSVLLGGFSGATPLRDVWEWDAVNRVWQDRTPVPLPASWPASIDAATYDTDRKLIIVFSSPPGATDTQVWEWDGSAGKF